MTGGTPPQACILNEPERLEKLEVEVKKEEKEFSRRKKISSQQNFLCGGKKPEKSFFF